MFQNYIIKVLFKRKINLQNQCKIKANGKEAAYAFVLLGRILINDFN